MPSKRPFLFGLGSGVISGALLLQLMMQSGAAETPNPPEGAPSTGAPSVGSAQEDANEAAGKRYTEEEIEAIRRQAAEQERKRVEQESKTEHLVANGQMLPAGQAEAVVHHVYISARMDAKDVAQLFAAAAIVPEAAALLDAIYAQRATTRIRAGAYAFHEGESAAAIVEAITFAPRE